MASNQIITQTQFKKDAIILARIIKDIGPKYHAILCVTGWWLHLAYYVSKILKIKKIQNLNISSYSGRYHSRIRDLTEELSLDDSKKYLVIDDLVDSWKTMELIKKKYEHHCYKMDFATLYHKGKADKPNYYLREYDKDDWITFYYEQDIDE